MSNTSENTIKVDDFVMDLGPLELEDIVGQDEAVEELKNLVNALQHKEIYDMWDYRIPKGILLTGSPGTGKTASVRALAKRLGDSATLMELRYLDIASKWVDMPIEQLRNFFALAEEESKSKHVIIFIDEMDSMIPNREDQLHETSMKRVNVFLEWMDGGFNTIKNITIIGATNRTTGIDKAALRPGRFGKTIDFKPLKKEHILKGIQIHFSKRKIESNLIKELDWDKIGESIGESKLNGADLPEIINRLLSSKISEHISLIDKADINLPTICTEDFITIIDSYKQSLKSDGQTMQKIGY